MTLSNAANCFLKAGKDLIALVVSLGSELGTDRARSARLCLRSFGVGVRQGSLVFVASSSCIGLLCLLVNKVLESMAKIGRTLVEKQEQVRVGGLTLATSAPRTGMENQASSVASTSCAEPEVSLPSQQPHTRRERIVVASKNRNLAELRKLAAEPGGFESSELRKLAWLV